jgi:adenine-specific DNA-methyltransferase
MTTKNPRLELTWIGKEHRPRLEPRILLEDPERSYHAEHRVSEDDIFDNRLIFGDNLLALKALEQEFTGKVKCIYIDPPFNTGEMFEHYDDGLEHSIWLAQMRERLEVLRSLLSQDGTLYIHIDDNELGYLIALTDEIFGRSNRCYVVTFQQGSATGHKAINPGMVTTSNFLLVYACDKTRWSPKRVFMRLEKRDSRYGTYIDNVQEHYSCWRLRTLMSAFAEHLGQQERGLKKRLGDEFEPLIAKFVESNAHRGGPISTP